MLALQTLRFWYVQPTAQHAFPRCKPAQFLASGIAHFSRPRHFWGAIAQVLMWANVIVMKAKFLYRLVQGGVGVDLNVPNRAFKGAEKPLNPAVLPRAVRVASLMANAERCHTCLKFVADKCAVVVGAQGLGFAKVGDQIPEQYQHGRGAMAYHA